MALRVSRFTSEDRYLYTPFWRTAGVRGATKVRVCWEDPEAETYDPVRNVYEYKCEVGDLIYEIHGCLLWREPLDAAIASATLDRWEIRRCLVAVQGQDMLKRKRHHKSHHKTPCGLTYSHQDEGILGYCSNLKDCVPCREDFLARAERLFGPFRKHHSMHEVSGSPSPPRDPFDYHLLDSPDRCLEAGPPRHPGLPAETVPRPLLSARAGEAGPSSAHTLLAQVCSPQLIVPAALLHGS